MTSSPSSDDATRLKRLNAFLERDPGNSRLLFDVAEAAFEADDFAQARASLDRLATLGPLSPSATNLAGLVAITESRFADAIHYFRKLQSGEGPVPDPGLRFNLAWAHAMLEQFKEAADLLDDRVIASVARAASLKVQMLHHLERYDEALALGETLAKSRADDQQLMGSLAILALDAEDPVLARHYADQASEDGQGLAAQGTLALGDEDLPAAERLFAAAIERQPASPRAWIGKGLTLLADHRVDEAVPALDHGASLFKDHVGSWIAAGWAHFATGDHDGARERFERALTIDRNFGETHGALAVLEIVSGHDDIGRHHAEVALRLDRASFGGQLARLLLLERAGDTSGAERIRARALSMPVGVDGRTIGQALAKLALRRN